MKSLTRTMICTMISVFLLSFSVVPAFTQGLTFDATCFHDASYLPYSEPQDKDYGGILHVIVRNNTAVPQEIDYVRLDGTDLNTLVSNETISWWRAWPETIPAYGVTTISIKATDSPIKQGETRYVTVHTSTSDLLHTESCYLAHPVLRIGNVIPSQDMQTAYIFLRNEHNEWLSVQNVWMNDEVTSQCGFIGGTGVAPNGGVSIIKVQFSTPLEPRTPYAVRVLAQVVNNGPYAQVAAPIRLVEPVFPIGNWGGSLLEPGNWDDQTLVRELPLDSNVGSYYGRFQSEDIYNRYFIKAINDVRYEDPATGEKFINLATLADNIGNEAIFAWMFGDEPDLHDKDPAMVLDRNLTIWRHDPDHYTYVNLCKNRAFGEFGPIPDIVAMDHYAMFSAPNIITDTWVWRCAELREAWRYADTLKKNTEPARMWVWPQLQSSWSRQPRHYGINNQFWGQIMRGAKGIQWYQVDRDAGDFFTTEQMVECHQIQKEINQVKNLLLYGEAADIAVEHEDGGDDFDSGVLVGEDAIVVVAVNDAITATGNWPVGCYNPGYDWDYVYDAWVEVPVPHWINVEQIYRVTQNGKVWAGPSGTDDFQANWDANTRILTLWLPTIKGDSIVIVAGANDTTPPSRPTCLNIAQFENSTNYYLSWKESTDNYGVMGYKVYRNGVEVADVRGAIYKISGYDIGQLSDWYVRAYDSAGNLSDWSYPYRHGRFQWFDDDYLERWWFENNGSADNVTVANGVLSLDVTGIDPYMWSSDVYLNTTQYRYLKVTMNNMTSNTAARIFWWNGQWNTTWFAINPNQNEIGEYFYDLGSHPDWTGVVTQLRFDPVDSAIPGGHVDIDMFRVSTDMPNVHIWPFNTAGYFEGWTLVDTQNGNVNNGVLSFDTNGGNPHLYAYTKLNAGVYKYLKIRMKNWSDTENALLWLHRQEDNVWVPQYIKTYPYSDFTDYLIDLTDNPGWYGTCDMVLLDPINTATNVGHFEIDHFEIMSTPHQQSVWQFDTPDHFERWAMVNQIANAAVVNPNWVNGWLSFDVTGGDPFMVIDQLGLPAASHDLFQIRMKNSTAASSLRIYWITDQNPYWSESQAASLSMVPNDTIQRDYSLDLSGVGSWSGNIIGLRVDPGNPGYTGQIEIDKIQLLDN